MALAGLQVVLGRVGLRLLNRVVNGGVAGERGPAGDDVEEPEPDHRDVQRARHVALGVLGLLAVVRRHLEPDPGPEREEQPDADRAGRQRSRRREALERVHRVDRGRREVAVPEHEPVEDQQHHDLGDQPDAEHDAGHADVEIGQQRDDQHHGQRQPRPGHVEPELGQLQVEEVGEAAAQRRLEHRVGQQRAEPGAHADLPAEAVTDVGVEAARRGLLPRHGHVANREDDQHDRGEHERGRRADAVAEADHDRGVEQHRRYRRGAGHGEEQHPHQADGALPQLMDIRAFRDVHALQHADLVHGNGGTVAAGSCLLLGIGHAASLLSGPGLVRCSPEPGTTGDVAAGSPDGCPVGGNCSSRGEGHRRRSAGLWCDRSRPSCPLLGMPNGMCPWGLCMSSSPR